MVPLLYQDSIQATMTCKWILVYEVLDYPCLVETNAGITLNSFLFGTEVNFLVDYAFCLFVFTLANLTFLLSFAKVKIKKNMAWKHFEI